MTQTAHKGKLYQLQYLIDSSCFIVSHMLVFGCRTPFDSTKLIYFANTSRKADSPTGVLRERDRARRRAVTVRSVEASNLSICMSAEQLLFPFRPLQIQRQQLLQNLLIGQMTLPPIRRKYSLIESLVREIKPGGTGVV